MSLKEYNEWELRFLQVLVPRKRLLEIMIYIMKYKVDKFLWRGDLISRQGFSAKYDLPILSIDRALNEDSMDAFAHSISHLALSLNKNNRKEHWVLGHPDDKLEWYDENGMLERKHDPEKQICEKCGIDMEKDKYNGWICPECKHNNKNEIGDLTYQ